MCAAVVTLPIISNPSAEAQTPGVPQPPSVVFGEDFQNIPGTVPVPLGSYVGVNGETYTADPAWLTSCNGEIVNYNMTQLPANCTAGSDGMNALRSMAYALGVLRGFTDPRTNNALSAYTDQGNNTPVDPGAGKVQFQTNQPIALPSGTSKHYVLFSVDAASMNCPTNPSQLQFNLVSGTDVITDGNQIDTCNDPRGLNIPVVNPVGVNLNVRTGTYAASEAIPFTGSSVVLQMVNNQGSGNGNDSAVDNFRVLDATPQLSKSFSPDTQVAGLPTQLTFTITNTDDLLAKPGWSFTDNLPAGMTVADPASESTTCANSTVTAPAESGSISVTGDLLANEASCTVTVNVTGIADSYINGPSNVTTSGVYAPEPTPVTFETPNPSITVTKTPSPATANDAGDTVTYDFEVTNNGNVDLSDIALTDAQTPPAGALDSGPTCPSTSLAVGESMPCTATYTLTQADVDHGRVGDSATVTGDPPAILGLPPAIGTATATVNVPSAAELTISKTASPATVTAADQQVTYDFEVKNTGNVTIHDIAIDETAFSGTGTPSAITCPVTTLAPGEDTTCTATYSVTQNDIDAGRVTNTARATGTSPTGTTVDSLSDTATVTATQTKSLALVKTASPATPSTFRSGQAVTYDFEVTNTGNVTIHNIAIDETAFSGTGTPSAISCPTTTLAPGASTTCSAIYTLTTEDIDAGKVTNTATATGIAPDDSTVTSPEDSAEVTANQDPALTLVKKASVSGNVITYDFEVTNSGNTTITDIAIDETAFSGTGTPPTISCPVTTLAPGDDTTCTATAYAATTDDIDAGHLTNTAHATGTGPSGSTVESPSDTETADLEQAPALTLAKTVTPSTVTHADSEVTYDFEVKNTGNTTVHNIAIAETDFSGTGTAPTISCPVSTLAPGDDTTCTATYSLTQSDIDAGRVTNTAHATGTDPSGTTVDSPPDMATVTATASPALTLAKTVTPDTVTGTSDSVTYHFEVTNTGNVTIDNLIIDETAFSGTGTPSAITCPATTLAPEASTICEATYTLTQDDIDAGHVTNTAHAIGTDPSGTAVDSPSDSATVTATASPALTLAKTVTPDTVTGTDANVVYSFKVTNSGNVTIDDIAIDETAFSGTGTPPAITCPVTTLAPGDDTTCVATYAITLADMDAGEVTNTAHATGTDPTGTGVSSESDSAKVTATQDPTLTITKTVLPDTVTAADQQVTYEFEVGNTGNVTVHDIAIDERAFSGTGTPLQITCAVTTLEPGGSTICTATYSVTQEDIDAGHVTNTAVATGTSPTDSTVTSQPDSAELTATPSPSLTLVKSASPSTPSTFRSGQAVTYDFEVTNTGNVTIHDIAIDETAFSGTGTPSVITCPVTTLAPGASTTCTATYTLTTEDIDAGKVTNTATATGTAPSGTAVTSSEDSAEVTASQDPALALVKTASVSGNVITYRFEVTNTGNTTIHDIAIDETAFSGTGTRPTITCPVTTLAPGDDTTCTATYTATTADIDAGKVTNTATATGTSPSGAAVISPEDSATATLEQDPALAVIKKVPPGTVTMAGQQITYRFVVTNTGNTTIGDIAVNETQFSGTGTRPSVTCMTTTLEPGTSTVCTATYSVTQADMDKGRVYNAAVVTGTGPGGVEVTFPEESAVVHVTQAPELAVVKSVSPSASTSFRGGQVVVYSFQVTNTGNVTVHDISIAETEFSGTGAVSEIACPTTTLAPGEKTTCTAVYTLTLDDINAGKVTNTAAAIGFAPDESRVTSPQDSADVTAAQNPALALLKSFTTSGNVVTYRFVVTNTGNTTINDIAIDETQFSGTATLATATCTATTLAPTASTICTATYTLTTADIDAGHVSNSAVATGTSPSGAATTSPPDMAVVAVAQDPSLAVVKTASLSGNVVTYRFVVTNTGNTTINDIAIDETAFSGTATPPAATCTTTTLAPSAATICTATYTLTTADIDAGHVSNSAVAVGTAPTGLPAISMPSEATVTVTQTPALTLVKTASPSTAASFHTGQQVTYNFAVTNTGNVTINNIAIAETEFSGTGTPSAITCPTTTLAPGEHTTCSATYILTQADVDARGVINIASAVGTTPSGADVTSPPATAAVPVTHAPMLGFSKTAAPVTVTAAGQQVTYRFVVANLGNATVHDIRVKETGFVGTGTLSPITCPVTTLTPGDLTTCTASYTVTQADIDAGKVANTAVATATFPSGQRITSRPSTASVTARKVSIVSGVPGGGSGPNTVEIALGIALILTAGSAATGLVAHRRRIRPW